MEAGVLQQQDVAVRHRRDGGFRLRTDAIVGEGHRAAERALKRDGQRLQRVRPVRAVLRPAEMRQEDRAAASVGDLAQARQHPGDAGVVEHGAVGHRHVEVDAQQHALAADVDVVERAEAGRRGRRRLR